MFSRLRQLFGHAAPAEEAVVASAEGMGPDAEQFEFFPVNVPDDWIESGSWRTWEAPRNIVAGESHYKAALERLAGKPRRAGYLIPVTVTFVRESWNHYDPNAFRAEVEGEHVGYLARGAAAELARVADELGLVSFVVCGVLRGDYSATSSLGVHVWLDRRLSPGLDIAFSDDVAMMRWPPYDGEGVHCSADET